MFRFFRLFRSSQHLHHSIILFLLLLLSIGPVSSQEVTPEPQPSPTALPTSTLPPPPTTTPIPTNTDLPPPTATPLPTNTETPTATSTSIPTNTVTLTPTEEITPTPSPSITAEPSLSPSPTVASRATQVPLPSETPFVPSPTPSARDTLQSAQPQAFSFSSSLPINTINLSPGSDDSDLIAALVTANQSCSNHTVINLPAGQTYTLTSVNNTFFGGTGLPVIVCEVTINGDATQIIRGVGAPNFRIFGVNNTRYSASERH